MQELNLRLGQATPLTYSQEDENFKRIKSAIDALEIQVAGAGLGTVTSVGLALPNIFTVSGSPVTTAGSLTASLAIQTQNLIFASPDGTSGQPTFRALLNADLPTVSIAKGGLGLTTVATNNQIIASNGTSYEGRTISVGTGLTLTQGTGSINFAVDPSNINLTSLGGVLTTPQGGTGISTAPANGELLIGNGTVWQKNTLTAGSGINIVNGAGTITISNTATGVSQLNYLTGNIFMNFGSSGNFPAISENNITSEITFNIPNAGPAPITRGLLTAADWTTFNSKVGGSGTANYIPKFTASGTIGDSVLYEGLLGNVGKGTITPIYDFHIVDSNASLAIESPSGSSTFRILNTGSGTTSSLLLSSGGLTTTNIDFTINTGHKVYANGNTQFLKGVAMDGFVYFNATGSTSFSSNEQYGIILGAGSDGTMNVTLPLTPMNGQEVCILIEEDKTLTVSSGVPFRNIYGKAMVPSSILTLSININTHGSAIIFKFAGAGNGGVGAWYLTGF